MIRVLMYLLGFRYRVVAFRTEKWSPIQQEMLFISRCKETPPSKKRMIRNLPVDILMVIWKKRPAVWYYVSMSDLIHDIRAVRTDNPNYPRLARIWYSDSLEKLKLPITFSYNNPFSRPNWPFVFSGIGFLNFQIPNREANKDDSESCYHPMSERIRTHRGTHCNKCGKRF